jgi:hypothetical protein
VQLHHKYKLIPDIPSRYGAIVLNKVSFLLKNHLIIIKLQPILSDRKYEIDVEFKLQSEEDMSHGMSVMLLREPPKFPEEFHNEFGYKPDYKGLGVFLYRSESRNKWVSNR